ncbi:MAG: hypothetical protein Q8L35_07060, partial [Actinomycetota bacterium]|nr:hypothetical protein [Actinomycetota bacterium]
MTFSKNLIDQTKEYFRKKSGARLSDAEASTYLEELGSLGLVVFDLLASSRSSSQRLGAGRALGGSGE